MRKRLLGMEPWAIICVPERPFDIECCHTGYFAYSAFLNGLEGMFLCNYLSCKPACSEVI